MGKASAKAGKPTRSSNKGDASPAGAAQVKYEDDDELDFGNDKPPLIMRAVAMLIRVGVLVAIGYEAYDIRLYAIKDYGRVIHEVTHPHDPSVDPRSGRAIPGLPSRSTVV